MTQLDLIRKKRDEAINQLNQQKSNAENEFYGQRNNVDTEMMQELAMQKDALARSGWSQGGENLGAMMKTSGNRSAKLMSLRNKQLEFNQGIDNKISDENINAEEQELQVKLQEQERLRRLKALNPKPKAPSKTDLKNAYSAQFQNALSNNDYALANKLLNDDKEGIIRDLGWDYWKSLERALDDERKTVDGDFVNPAYGNYAKSVILNTGASTMFPKKYYGSR